ncbi:MAG: hypothetical protein K2H40_10455 [Lachnospiraceae bacterium]|nr:hypothetical protein [Lachnospiraceae bacterium]
MKEDVYLVSKWALIRRNELVDIPDKLEIHPDFLRQLSHAAFESAFREIGEMFYRMYSDMADSPQRFGLPLYKIDEYDYFSDQAREARRVPWNPFYFMLCLFACGDFKGDIFIADTAEVRKLNKAGKTNLLLEALCDQGFVFDGIKKYRLSSGDFLEIDYPDNRNVLEVLSVVAKKVKNTQLKDVKNYYSNSTAFSNAFIGWNYKVLTEDLHTCSLAEGCDYVADKMHDEADREVIFLLDKILTERGYTRKKGDFNEGPSVRYYCGKSAVYDYALNADTGKLYLELRIRSAEKCLAYLKECPERITEVFRHSDVGCQNRIKGTCRCGVKYEFEKEEKWHCGCCGAPFKIHPIKEDIPHYLKLLELGRSK